MLKELFHCVDTIITFIYHQLCTKGAGPHNWILDNCNYVDIYVHIRRNIHCTIILIMIILECENPITYSVMYVK